MSSTAVEETKAIETAPTVEDIEAAVVELAKEDAKPAEMAPGEVTNRAILVLAFFSFLFVLFFITISNM